MKYNIIFLDLDGVLNGYNFFTHLIWRIVDFLKIREWYKKHTRDIFGVHEEKLKRLAKIVRKTDAKVVLSASIRYAYWNTPSEEREDLLKEMEDGFKKYGIDVIDVTPRDKSANRSKEIIQWLNKHRDMVKSFVILDDEKSDLQCFVDTRLVQTSSIKKGIIKGHWQENTGLKNKHIKKVIKILQNPFDENF